MIKIIISPGVRGIILIGLRKKALGESGSRISRSWRLNVHLTSNCDKYRGNSHRNLVCLWRAATPTRKHARSCPLWEYFIFYANSALRRLSRNHRSGGFLFGMGTIEQGSLSHTGPNSH